MKKAFKTLLITIALCMIAVIVLVVVADPFFHYHAPLNREGVHLYNEVYQAPGVVAHFKYDTVMLGTSMTENFRTDWFEEYGEHAVKVPYSGAKLANIQKLLDIVLNSGNEVKRVYIDLNDYQLSAADPDELFGGEPDYLYDNNLLTDVQYIFNKDVVLESIEDLRHYIKHDGNEAEAYTWDDPQLFGKALVLEDISTEHTEQAWVNNDDDRKDLRNKAKANVKGLVEIAKANPDVEFVFFYPPYSMAYWYEQKMENSVTDRLDMYLASVESLMDCNNIEVYFFMDDYDTIYNLDDYRDMCHYRQQINRIMLDEMHGEKYKVDVTQISDRIKELANKIEEYSID